MTDHPFHYDQPKVRISDSEIVVQKQCLKMIAGVFRKTRVAAVPNGQKRTRWQAQRAKAEGMSKGFVDLVVIGQDRVNFHAPFPPLVAFIELKANGSMQKEQLDWLTFMAQCGHHCGVFRSDKTLEAKMREWGFR